MEFDLTISPDYCGDWGRWECFREFIQNCLDGDQAGYPSNIQYTTSGILHIHNKGASLKPENLVLGVTSKGDGTYRGKFGEGLKVSMARVVSMARDRGIKESLKIKTGKECWHPCIVHSPKFNTDILRVNVTKCVDNYGLTVSIPNVTPEEWNEIKSRVLALKKSYTKVSTHKGELLLDPEHKGQLFVKGLWVGKLPETSAYGFNFTDSSVSIDRDRKMADAYTVRYAAADILEGALVSGQLTAKSLLENLKDESSLECRALAWHSVSTDFRQSLAKAWVAENGTAVPVEGMVQASEVSAMGQKSSITSKTIVALIGQVTGTFESLKKDNHFAIKKVLNPSDLTPEQNTMIVDTCVLFAKALGENVDVRIVDFANPSILGMYGAEKISVSTKSIGTKREFMDTLIHELGHRKGALDLTQAHMDEVTLITSKIILHLMG